MGTVTGASVKHKTLICCRGEGGGTSARGRGAASVAAAAVQAGSGDRGAAGGHSQPRGGEHTMVHP